MQHNSPSASARQLRTLLVEADSETQQMLELALSIRGHIVATCESSTAARDLLRLTPYQIVVIGSDLPDAHGADLASDLRSDAGGRPVLVLLRPQLSTKCFHGQRTWISFDTDSIA